MPPSEPNIPKITSQTNKIFCLTDQNNKNVYYIPVYLRLKVKDIVSLDVQKLSGQVNCTFILSVSYDFEGTDFSQYLIKSLEITLSRNKAIALNGKDLDVVFKKKDEQNKVLNFTIRKIVTAQLKCDIFYSPFQKYKFIISATMRSIRTKIKTKDCQLKFNFMDYELMDVKFSLARNLNFGIYQVADKKLQVQYTNQLIYGTKNIIIQKEKNLEKPKSNNSINTVQSSRQLIHQEQNESESKALIQDKDIKHFQYAHFILFVYKRPVISILTVFIPLILLGIINISIFYQDVTQSGQYTINIATVLVSFISLIGVVRENTANSSTVTFTEILVFIEASTTLLTFAHMIKFRNAVGFQENLYDGLLVASIVTTAIVFFSIVGLILIYKCYWKPQYHTKEDKTKEQNEDYELYSQDWSNIKCDEYFKNYQLQKKKNKNKKNKKTEHESF